MPETNYEPSPWGTPTSPSGNCIGGNCHGDGSPEGSVIGFGSYTYSDDSSPGDFYVFNGTDGTSTGWNLVSGGGSGAGLTYHQSGDLDPNGVITGSVGDVFHSRVSLGGDGSTWWKTAGNGNSTGWE